jgi:hypothetical protein
MLTARVTTRWTALAAGALVLSGCASMNVNSYLAPDAGLTAGSTYNWASTNPRSTGDPRLDNNMFFEEAVQTAVEQRLTAKGFEKSASPDLLVHVHASITQEIVISGGERGGEPCEGCTPEVYDAGTLVIDLVDARTNRLVWRGWAVGSFEGIVDDQAWMERRMTETVDGILDRLPL